MRNKLVLANEDVQRLVAACKAETARNKCAATIAVVDESANLLYLERMEDADYDPTRTCDRKAATCTR